MYVCMHACMYVCMYVCTYVCMFVYGFLYVCMYVCSVNLYVYIYMYLYVFMYLYTYSTALVGKTLLVAALGHVSNGPVTARGTLMLRVMLKLMDRPSGFTMQPVKNPA